MIAISINTVCLVMLAKLSLIHSVCFHKNTLLAHRSAKGERLIKHEQTFFFLISLNFSMQIKITNFNLVAIQPQKYFHLIAFKHSATEGKPSKVSFAEKKLKRIGPRGSGSFVELLVKTNNFTTFLLLLHFNFNLHYNFILANFEKISYSFSFILVSN